MELECQAGLFRHWYHSQNTEIHLIVIQGYEWYEDKYRFYHNAHFSPVSVKMLNGIVLFTFINIQLLHTHRVEVSKLWVTSFMVRRNVSGDSLKKFPLVEFCVGGVVRQIHQKQ